MPSRIVSFTSPFRTRCLCNAPVQSAERHMTTGAPPADRRVARASGDAVATGHRRRGRPMPRPRLSLTPGVPRSCHAEVAGGDHGTLGRRYAATSTASVVDDDALEIAVVLQEHGVESLAKEVRPVVRRDDHGEEGMRGRHESHIRPSDRWLLETTAPALQAQTPGRQEEDRGAAGLAARSVVERLVPVGAAGAQHLGHPDPGATALDVEDFGVVELGATVVALAQVAANLGFGAALVRRAETSEVVIQTALWLSLMTAGIVGTAVAAGPAGAGAVAGAWTTRRDGLPAVRRWRRPRHLLGVGGSGGPSPARTPLPGLLPRAGSSIGGVRGRVSLAPLRGSGAISVGLRSAWPPCPSSAVALSLTRRLFSRQAAREAGSSQALGQGSRQRPSSGRTPTTGLSAGFLGPSS